MKTLNHRFLLSADQSDKVLTVGARLEELLLESDDDDDDDDFDPRGDDTASSVANNNARNGAAPAPLRESSDASIFEPFFFFLIHFFWSLDEPRVVHGPHCADDSRLRQSGTRFRWFGRTSIFSSKVDGKRSKSHCLFFFSSDRIETTITASVKAEHGFHRRLDSWKSNAKSNSNA